ncbi:hypothetical protein P154DRAFT_23815 [Amniculicola lignicola CBS 123094]|uniref:Uncharacterized protein n=1 Tax=Amniculicola lignicola CBS 123094 TaxID=1392246 RepID=A0A6A5X269_9PLEO|nr:hypothetical protein P154DRAFT_23815 [Amniculicola lignicola CBS 123094]
MAEGVDGEQGRWVGIAGELCVLRWWQAATVGGVFYRSGCEVGGSRGKEITAVRAAWKHRGDCRSPVRGQLCVERCEYIRVLSEGEKGKDVVPGTVELPPRSTQQACNLGSLRRHAGAEAKFSVTLRPGQAQAIRCGHHHNHTHTHLRTTSSHLAVRIKRLCTIPACTHSSVL